MQAARFKYDSLKYGTVWDICVMVSGFADSTGSWVGFSVSELGVSKVLRS